MKRAVLFFFLGLCPHFLAAEAVPQIDPIRAQAKTLYRQGQYDEATRLYHEIVKLQPGNVETLKEAMWGFWNMNKYDAAAEVASHIHTLAPQDPEARNILDWVPLQQLKKEERELRRRAVDSTQAGRITEALQLYKQLAGLEPDQVAVQHEYMWALWNAGRLEQASQVATHVLQLRAGDAEALKVKSDSHQQLSKRRLAELEIHATDLENAGRKVEAVNLYKKLYEDEPSNPVALRMLVWGLSKNGQYEDAKTYAFQLMAMEPNSTSSWNLLARMQAQNDQTEESLASYAKSLALDPHQPDIQMEIAKDAFMRRDFAAAILALRKAEIDNSNVRDLYPLLGKSYFYSGHYVEAEKAWAEAVERFPDNSEFKFSQIQAHYYAGDPDGAFADMQALYNTTKNVHAFLFFVDDLIARKQITAAENKLEEKLTTLQQADETWVMKLAALYQQDSENDRLQILLDRFLSIWPNHQPSLSMKASSLYEQHRYKEALKVYEALLQINPYETSALQGLASCHQALVHPGEVIKAADRLLSIDPTEPHFIFFKADALYQAGYHTAAHQLVTRWLRDNKRSPVLPVILYHDLTTFSRDPSLAYPYHYTVSTFEAHMKALHDAGYTAVTMVEVNAWLAGKHELPKKPIVIAFDDNRRDSMEYADPILAKYHLKATMFVALVNVDYHHPPAFVSWDELRHYKQTGRWELQSHGDIAHIFIPSTPEGGKGLFLVNRQWLDDQHRIETVDEWKQRISTDHQACLDKMMQHLGDTPSAYAWPEGLYGQQGNSNSAETSPIDQALVLKYFKTAWTQDHVGLNVRSKDPGHMTRIIPNNDWTGEQLLAHFRDHGPIVVATEKLLDWAAWEGKTYEAYQWLAELKDLNPTQGTLLSEESAIRYSAGDYRGGAALANHALMLGDDAEIQKMVQTYESKQGAQWAPSFSYQRDNRERIGRTFLQTLSIPSRNLVWRLEHLYGRYTEPGFSGVSDNALGLGLDARLSLFHSVSFDAMGHSLAAQDHHDEWTGSASLQSKWTDAFATTLSVGRSLYDTAPALDSDIWTRYVEGSGHWTLDLWDVTLRGKGTALSDDNRRVLGQLTAARSLTDDASWRLVYRFTYDNTHFISPAYYSPQRLELNEIGPEFSHSFAQKLDFYVRYLPGVGLEHDQPTQLAHDLEAYLRFRFTPLISLTPSYEYERTPTYDESFYSVEFRYVF